MLATAGQDPPEGMVPDRLSGALPELALCTFFFWIHLLMGPAFV